MPAPRFGIGEWYGRSFFELSAKDRLAFAEYKPAKNFRLKKAERLRLAALESKLVSQGNLTQSERVRLDVLRAKLAQELATNKPCPFRSTESDVRPCTKEGGVCSLRLYEQTELGISAVSGERGGIRALCPNRFHDKSAVLAWVGEVVLGTNSPLVVGEVGFLESAELLDGGEGEDVGRIDMVLVDSSKPRDYPLAWAAVELQAVYFSGKEMVGEFKAIAADVRENGSGLIWPTENRRPDYRSSGPKRLMPQLQIKVPTLRRWGKKMAVVVDRSFFESLGQMDEAPYLSNADIAWFIVDFELDLESGRFSLVRTCTKFTTLEEAVTGLTGGTPLSQHAFEDRIRGKLGSLGGKFHFVI